MDFKAGIIVNKTKGTYVETVAYNQETLEVKYYELKEDEELITTPLPNFFVKPKWLGEKWVESATDEEIAKWEEEHKPVEPEPSELDIALKEIEDLKTAINKLTGGAASE